MNSLIKLYALALLIATSASGQEVIKVEEIEKIKAAKDKVITVRGKISRASKSKSGINFINFPGEHFSLVMFTRDAKFFPKGEPADLYEAGKIVDVTGKIEFYKEKPQIVLKDPSQIRLAPGQEGPPPKKDVPKEEKVDPKKKDPAEEKPVKPEPVPEKKESEDELSEKPDPDKYFKD